MIVIDKLCIAQRVFTLQNYVSPGRICPLGGNVVREGSPSRLGRVRRISIPPVFLFANSRLSLHLLPSMSFRANECESRNLHTFDTVLVISVKRSLDSALRNYGMLATGKHTFQNRFATLGMTKFLKFATAR